MSNVPSWQKEWTTSDKALKNQHTCSKMQNGLKV